MAEIEITLPTVQYGNVKVRVTPEEFGLQYGIDNPYALGMGAATYLNLFTQGFKEGATMDVSAPVGASKEAASGDPQAAADRLADGRSPRTVDEANEMARQVIENELGPTTEVDGQGPEGPGEGPSRAPSYQAATEIETTSVIEASGIAPWDDSDLKVDAKPKPWETDSGW